MLSNNNPRTIVGIDVSKDKLDIHVLFQNKTFMIDNHPKAIAGLIKRLKHEYPIPFVVMENTGGLEKTAHSLCTKHGIDVHIAHSNRVYHFAKQKGYFAKTDKKDAETIAEYAHQEQVEATPSYNEEETALRELSNRRAQIVDDLHDEKCRLTRPLSSSVKRSINRKVKFLEQEKKQIEKEMHTLIHNCPEKKETMKRLQTFNGIGPAISQGLVALLPELGQMSRSQIAAILGVAPKNNDSGKKQGRRRIVGGRFNARRLLYMGALVSIRHNETLKLLYNRLIEKGKPAKVAIVAVMRKIIITLNAMIRDKKDWAPNYVGGPR